MKTYTLAVALVFLIGCMPFSEGHGDEQIPVKKQYGLLKLLELDDYCKRQEGFPISDYGLMEECSYTLIDDSASPSEWVTVIIYDLRSGQYAEQALLALFVNEKTRNFRNGVKESFNSNILIVEKPLAIHTMGAFWISGGNYLRASCKSLHHEAFSKK